MWKLLKSAFSKWMNLWEPPRDSKRCSLYHQKVVAHLLDVQPLLSSSQPQTSSVPMLVTLAQCSVRAVKLSSCLMTTSQTIQQRVREFTRQMPILRIQELMVCWPCPVPWVTLSTKTTLCRSQKTKQWLRCLILKLCHSAGKHSLLSSPVMASGTWKPLKKQLISVFSIFTIKDLIQGEQ